MNNHTETPQTCYFDLRLDRSENGVTAVVTNSPAGQSSSALLVGLPLEGARIPYDELLIADQIALGSGLWSSIFSQTEIAELWRASNVADSPYLRLTISDLSVAALPWELLYDQRTARFVALNARAALIRFLPLPLVVYSSPVGLPLRVLFTGCSPAGLPLLEIDKERQLLSEALPGRDAKLAGGTQAGSMSRLASELFHGADVWHFAGHGTEQALIFDDDAGHPVTVDAFTVGTLLTGAGVRVVVVNACSAGAGGGVSSSIAGALLRAGVPVVIAMQSQIPDSAAVVFCRSLYGAIALGHSVEQAMTAGRRAVFALGGTAGASWWMPALFSRNNAPLVLVDVARADAGVDASPATLGAQPTASGKSAISQGGVAISGHVGGNVMVLTSPKS